MRKKTIEEVRSYVESKGDKLFSKVYENNRVKLEIRCGAEGHTFWINWSEYYRGVRCSECDRLRQLKPIKEIKEYVEGEGDRLISIIYVNSKTKLRFKCGNEGHTFWMRWNCYQQGERCPECDRANHTGEKSNLYKGGVTKLNIPLYNTYAHQIDFCEEVRRDPDNMDWLQVRCTNCNEWFSPKATEFQRRAQVINDGGGSRFYCSEKCKHSCSIYGQHKFPKGFKKDYHRHPDYNIWAKMIKERDNYECQICGETEGVNAHHYEGLNVNDIESLDLDMGVTLCAECHHRSHTGKGCTYYDLQKRNICK